jgi:hypothetical protein
MVVAPAHLFNKGFSTMIKCFDKVHAVVGARLMRRTDFADGSHVYTGALVEAAAPPPKRVHLAVERLLARAGIQASAGKFKVATLDIAFANAGLSLQERMHAKDMLARADLLD